MSTLLCDMLPAFYRELESLLLFGGHADQRRQLPEIHVHEWAHSPERDAIVLHTADGEPGPDLDVVHLHTPTGAVLVELDASGAVVQIEVLHRDDVRHALGVPDDAALPYSGVA